MMHFHLFAIFILAVFTLIPNIATAESVSEIYKLTYENNVYDIPYTITNGTIKDVGTSNEVFNIIILIDAEADGTLEISIPRELIDRVDTYGKFESVEDSLGMSTYQDLEMDCNYRKILLSFRGGSDAIVFGNLGVMEPDADRTLKDKIPVVIEGKQFTILTKSESAICDSEFIQDKKMFSITIKGVQGTSNPVYVTIPQELLSGDFKVMVDGDSKRFDIEKTETDSKLSFDLDFPTNERKIQIIGTQVIPEFSFAIPTLAVSLISLLVFYRMKSTIKF